MVRLGSPSEPTLTVKEAIKQYQASVEARFRDRVHNKTLEHYAAKLAEKDLGAALRDAWPEFDAVVASVRAEEQAQRAALVEALTAVVDAADAKTIVPFDDPMRRRADAVINQARAALAHTEGNK